MPPSNTQRLNFVAQKHHQNGLTGEFLGIDGLPSDNFGINKLKRAENQALVVVIQQRKPKNILFTSKSGLMCLYT
jgi:hypothetical protein